MLSGPLYFVLLVGVLIFVHELGHFTWAKLFKVKVLKFSLGFGPKLISFRRGETEYVVSALPLGGFVRMLGEDPSEVVGPEDQGRALQDKPLWKRFVIVFAGPAMNLMFPVLLFFIVHLGMPNSLAPTVGRVVPDMPAAQAGLRPGDRIRAIDGVTVKSFDDLQRIVSGSIGESLTFELDRFGEARPVRLTIRPKAEIDHKPLGLTERVGRIGVIPFHPSAIVGITDPVGPAAVGGLRTFDVITSVDGRPVEHWLDLERALSRTRGEPVRLGYLRADSRDLGFASLESFRPGEARVVPDPARTGPAAVGIELAEMYVASIDPNSPEYAMGLRRGDRIDSLDARPVTLWQQLGERLMAASDKNHQVTWSHAGAPRTGAFKMHRESRYDEEAGAKVRRYVFHTTNWIPTQADEPVRRDHPVLHAAAMAFQQTGELIHLLVTALQRMLQGKLSMKTVGGPIMLFDIAGQAAERGASSFLLTMGFVSINLGVLNLLPIPVLDGGHLLFLFIEGITRRPVPLKTREIASMVGLSMLVLLMVFAFKNDIERYWDSIAGFFTDFVS